MTLHDHRSRFEGLVAPLVAWCARNDVDPNTLSVVGFATTVAGAGAYYVSGPTLAWPLIVGSALVAAGATLDSVDGMLARRIDKAGPLGDYLDHALDRFADVAILVALTLTPWVPVWIGLFAVVGTLLTSYMGTQAQAVGVGRDYGGLLGRADRIAVLVVAPPIQAILQVAGTPLPLGLNLVYLGVAWIAVAGNITALQRFWAAYRELSDEHTRLK